MKPAKESLFLDTFSDLGLEPLLMAPTDRLDPHDMQDMKKIWFSFVKRASKDLHVLQVTYSTIERRGSAQIVRGTRCEMRDHTDVTTKDIFYLFLLEATFDN